MQVTGSSGERAAVVVTAVGVATSCSLSSTGPPPAHPVVADAARRENKSSSTMAYMFLPSDTD